MTNIMQRCTRLARVLASFRAPTLLRWRPGRTRNPPATSRSARRPRDAGRLISYRRAEVFQGAASGASLPPGPRLGCRCRCGVLVTALAKCRPARTRVRRHRDGGKNVRVRVWGADPPADAACLWGIISWTSSSSTVCPSFRRVLPR